MSRNNYIMYIVKATLYLFVLVNIEGKLFLSAFYRTVFTFLTLGSFAIYNCCFEVEPT